MATSGANDDAPDDDVTGTAARARAAGVVAQMLHRVVTNVLVRADIARTPELDACITAEVHHEVGITRDPA